MLWATGDFEGSLRAYKAADALLANDSEDGLRASVLAALAFGLLVTGQAERSLTTAGIAVRLAAAIGAVRDELHAAITAAVAKASLGRVDEATRELLGCLQQARNLDDPELVMRCYGNLTYTHAVAGRPERVAEVGAEGAAYCRRYGPVISFASPMMSNYVVALNVLGRWDQAIEIAHETLADATADSVVIELHSIVAVIAARRGDVDQSRYEMERALGRLLDAGSFNSLSVSVARAELCVARAELCLLEGKWDMTLSIIAEVLPFLEEQDESLQLLQACCLGLRTIADRRESVPRPRTDEPDENSEYVSRVASAVLTREPIPGTAASMLACQAEMSRASSADTVDQWVAAADAYARSNDPYRQAYCLFRLGARHLDKRASADSGVALGQAMRLAENLGAKPLINEIKRLAVIGRVHIFTPARPPSPPATTHGLSPRELEIVSCLIEGNTNKQISQKLFISERTVGVHVGNILNKLGVRNRTEAATIGLRLGLDT